MCHVSGLVIKSGLGCQWPDLPTAEHYYRWHKSFDPNYRATIRASERPLYVQRLAAAATMRSPALLAELRVQEVQTTPRADWNEAKLDVMRRTDRANMF
jgi:predicted NAD-dependent protein-ADP-ribosyltransferase YbiA (DUF1768 family)